MECHKGSQRAVVGTVGGGIWVQEACDHHQRPAVILQTTGTSGICSTSGSACAMLCPYSTVPLGRDACPRSVECLSRRGTNGRYRNAWTGRRWHPNGTKVLTFPRIAAADGTWLASTVAFGLPLPYHPKASRCPPMECNLVPPFHLQGLDNRQNQPATHRRLGPAEEAKRTKIAGRGIPAQDASHLPPMSKSSSIVSPSPKDPDCGSPH